MTPLLNLAHLISKILQILLNCGEKEAGNFMKQILKQLTQSAIYEILWL